MRHDEPATKADLGQLKRELVAKIDANGRKIDDVEQKLSAKIDANGAKIDQVEQSLTAKSDANSAKIDANSAKIDANSAMLSRVSHQVVENSEQIGRLIVMAEESRESLNQILGTLDGLASGFAKLDQERVATNARLDRLEEDVQELKAR